MMNDRALRVLEFGKIRARLSEFALTDLGKERCLALAPQETLATAQEALEETEEAQVILTYLGGSPLVGFADVRPQLTLAEKGASLSPKALLDIARANLNCRMGERVMLRLAQFEVHSFEDLFQGVKSAPLEQWIPADGAFPVKGYSLSSQLHSVPDCQGIVKKAAADRQEALLPICSFWRSFSVRSCRTSTRMRWSI